MEHSSTPYWLSVVIPVYNVLPYLGDCLHSIASQGLAGVEIIAVEDCSTDGSAQELERLSREIPMRIVQHERNMGLSEARNSGLAVASGTYVWFLDSDDLLREGAIPALKRIVDEHSPDLVMCDFEMLRERVQWKHRRRGELHRRTFDGPSHTLGRDVGVLLGCSFSAGHLHTWSKIARRALWGSDLRFPAGRYFEDARTTPQLLSRANSWYHVPEPWVRYRQRAGSILNQMDLRKIDDMTSAFDGWRMAPDSTLDARFGVAFHMTRAFIGACKLLARKPDSEEVRQLFRLNRARYLANSPLSPPQTIRAFASRGWFWRAVRLGYWLRRTAKV